ncbi:forkhead box protein L2-like [Cygnus atratus]|uniref:forkhead box protein L2-like n=1 Tax=Cygnus atratus TaxID=8868 RepID=UPI0015D630E4|nr:forkhead box protein L2-like [Cygnus atratus]
MGDAAPGGTRPPGASFTIEYLLSGRDGGGPCAPPASSRSPPPAPRTPAEPGDKPAQSYIALISTAILSSPEKKLLLSDIYQWIMDKYPYFKNKEKSWRNSVRHNLSLNECFVKAGRSDNGKGHFWAIHPANVDDFAKGDYHRRRARRRIRRLAVNIGYCHPYALYGLSCCCPCCPPLPAGPPLAPPVLPPLALPAAPRLSLPERAWWGRVPGPQVLAPLFPGPRVPFL